MISDQPHRGETMATETAMAAALRRAGFQTGSRLHAAVVTMLKDAGGDRARAARALGSALVRDSEIRDHLAMLVVTAVAGDMHGTPAGGLNESAQEGHDVGAPGRRQDAGAIGALPEGHSPSAPAANGDGPGQESNAQEGHVVIARPSPASREAGASGRLPGGQSGNAPAREPSARDRVAALNARRGAANAALASLGWLGKAVIPHGPRLVDARWRDLPGLAERMKREGLKRMHLFYVLRRIEAEGARLGVMPQDVRWVETMPAEVTRRIAAECEPDKVAEDAKEFVARLGLTTFADALEHRHD